MLMAGVQSHCKKPCVLCIIFQVFWRLPYSRFAWGTGWKVVSFWKTCRCIVPCLTSMMPNYKFMWIIWIMWIVFLNYLQSCIKILSADVSFWICLITALHGLLYISKRTDTLIKCFNRCIFFILQAQCSVSAFESLQMVIYWL